MAKRPTSKKRDQSKTKSGKATKKAADKAESVKKDDTDGLTEKQQMVEKLFRHTNDFLEANKEDPFLVVESLAAILVRYAALLGPVEQMGARLEVLERLIGQESAQIQEIATAAAAAEQTKSD